MQKILSRTIDSLIGSGFIVFTVCISILTVVVFVFAIVFTLVQDFLSKAILPRSMKIFHQDYTPYGNNLINYIVLIFSLLISVFVIKLLLAIAEKKIVSPIIKLILTVMFKKDRQFSRDPTSDRQTLLKLQRSSDRLTRQNVVGNPNTPIEAIWQLAKEFPYQVIENPVFPLITLGNPQWIMEIDSDDLVELMNQPYVPDEFLRAATYHEDTHIRELAAKAEVQYQSVTTNRLEEIILSHGCLYSEIVRDHRITAKSLQLFATCDQYAIQKDLAAYCLNDYCLNNYYLDDCFDHSKYLKQKILEILIQNAVRKNDDALIVAILELKNLPDRYTHQLLVGLPNKVQLRSARSNRSPHFLAKLAQTPAHPSRWRTRILQALARNRYTPKNTLDELVLSPDKAVRLSLATRRSDLSEGLLVQLAIDPYPEIRKWLLANPHIPMYLPNRLQNHRDSVVQEFARQYLKANPRKKY
jgi:hypothetical protein